MNNEEIYLTKTERLGLINQYEILKNLDIENQQFYETNIIILKNGYSSHYKDLFIDISDEMTDNECTEVKDTIEMYYCINASYKKLEDKTGIDDKQLIFQGYDFNDRFQSRLGLYVSDGKKHKLIPWVDRILTKGGLDEFNSHSVISRQRYKQMLNEWYKIPEERKYSLSREEINGLLNASAS